MTKTTADKIIDLIAREAERAYRRGFQQGKVIGPQIEDRALIRWRYGRPLAKAPTPENLKPIPGIELARDRLLIESGKVEREVADLLRKAGPQ